jgi:hypothetical protein
MLVFLEAPEHALLLEPAALAAWKVPCGMDRRQQSNPGYCSASAFYPWGDGWSQMTRHLQANRFQANGWFIDEVLRCSLSSALVSRYLRRRYLAGGNPWHLLPDCREPAHEKTR